MRLLRFVLLFAMGCGGRVDDGPGTDSSLVGATIAAETGCPAGCDHMNECASQIDRDSCRTTCERDFARAEAANVWGACIAQLSCDQIQKGITMNYGPIGECYTRAQGQR